MKILLPLILLFCSLDSFAQQTESEKQLIAAQMLRSDSARLQTIQLNLFRFSKQYSTGTIITGFGIGLVAIGAAISLSGNSQDEPAAIATLTAGSLLTITGAVISIDAHKFFRRASGVRK